MTFRRALGIPNDDRILLVSPHLDDVVLSCEAFVGAPAPCDVLTVFTGRPQPAGRYPWDTQSGFADSDAAWAARGQEDDEAFAGTPHRRHRLDLLDLQYATTRTAHDAERLLAWVDGWLAQSQEAASVVLPVAAGPPFAPAGTPEPGRGGSIRRLKTAARDRLPRGVVRRIQGHLARRAGGEDGVAHPDHVFVRDTLGPPLARRGVRILWYEEMPYALTLPADHAASDLEVLVGAAVAGPIGVPIDPTTKAARVRAYRSQLALLTDPTLRIDDPAVLPARERYWVLPPA